MTAIENPDVLRVFESYPPAILRKLLALRDLIYETAAAMPEVGPLDEQLKWGEPAYITCQSNSGSTIRMAWKPSKPLQYALYFNCKTRLVDTFRTLFPNEFRFEGNRAIVFSVDDAVPMDALSVCFSAALTYHRDKSTRVA